MESRESSSRENIRGRESMGREEVGEPEAKRMKEGVEYPLYSIDMYTQDRDCAELVILTEDTRGEAPFNSVPIILPVQPNIYIQSEDSPIDRNSFPGPKPPWGKCRCDTIGVHKYSEMPQMQPSEYGCDYTPHTFTCTNAPTMSTVKVTKVDGCLTNYDGYGDLYEMYKVTTNTFAELTQVKRFATKVHGWKVFNGKFKEMDIAKAQYPRVRPFSMCTPLGKFTQNIPELDEPEDRVCAPTPPTHYFQWVLVFDIEAVPSSGVTIFPLVKNADMISQIGVQMCKYYPATTKMERYGECISIRNDGPKGVHEEAMLRVFLRDYASKAHFLMGWNSNKYDMAYIMETVSLWHPNLLPLMTKAFNRATLHPNVLIQNAPRAWSAMFESTQKGKVEIVRFSHMRGVITLDAMEQFISLSPNESQYTLDAIGKAFLGRSKIDIPYLEQFRLWREGDKDDMDKLAEYCKRDVELTTDIISKKMIVPGFIELCILFRLPPSFMMWKGVNSTLGPFNRIFATKGVVEPTYPKDSDSGHTLAYYTEHPKKIFNKDGYYVGVVKNAYQGATVIDPFVHVNPLPTATLDFKSLYPSIMIQDNCSPDTSIYTRGDDGKYVVSFIPKSEREGRIPKALRIMGMMRTKEKGLMKSDPDNRETHNQRQLKVKIGMNSEYGWMGAATADIPSRAIAEYVTRLGRESLEMAKRFVEGEEFLIDMTGVDLTGLVQREGLWMEGSTLRITSGMKVIYGDTDSIFVVCKGITTSSLMIHVFVQVEKDFKRVFSGDMDLELEKVIAPHSLFVKKKKYSGYEITWYFDKKTGGRVDSKPKFSAHGHDLVRRCVSKHARNTQRKMLELLNTGKVEEAMEVVRGGIRSLLAGEVPLEDYMMSAGFKNHTDKNGKILLASAVVQRMGEDDEVLKPVLGERVIYMVNGIGRKLAAKGAKVTTRVISNDQAHADKDTFFPCTDYYLRNQMENKMKPILKIYEDAGKYPNGCVKALFDRRIYDEVEYYNPKTIGLCGEGEVKRSKVGHAVLKTMGKMDVRVFDTRKQSNLTFQVSKKMRMSTEEGEPEWVGVMNTVLPGEVEYIATKNNGRWMRSADGMYVYFMGEVEVPTHGEIRKIFAYARKMWRGERCICICGEGTSAPLGRGRKVVDGYSIIT